MGMKRERQTDSAGFAPPTKKPRVDTGLAQIWDRLANDDEDIRVEAAHELLTKYCKSADFDGVQLVVRRLFKGLCSSRKNARPGFYLALLAALSMKPYPFGHSQLQLSEIFKILEIQTTPESKTSGQDERDHHFGRLLGCKALFDSNAISTSSEVDLSVGWSQVLDMICQLMVQKPWLRAPSTAVICSAISNVAQDSSYGKSDITKVVELVFSHLKSHKLLRTINGIWVWLHVQETLPKVKLPRGIWTSEDPLNLKDLHSLKQILLDSHSIGDNDYDNDLLGTSGWSPKLHHTWFVILRKLNNSSINEQVSFEKFWHEIVDEGLFAASSTPERKFTGLQVLECALKELKSTFVPLCFSKNLMACLVQTLRSPDEGYLRKGILEVYTNVQSCCSLKDASRADFVIRGLIVGCDYDDFDTLTRSKIMSSMFALTKVNNLEGIYHDLVSWLKHIPDRDDGPQRINQRRKNIMNILQRALCQSIRASGDRLHENVASTDEDWRQLSELVVSILEVKQSSLKEGLLSPVYDAVAYNATKEKVAQIMEALLAAGSLGQGCFLQAVTGLQLMDLDAEATINDATNLSWKYLGNLHKAVEALREQAREQARLDAATQDGSEHTQVNGMTLLLATLLYQVYDGDAESAELLDDVNAMAKDMLSERGQAKVADHLSDIVLSLVSRPSKFLRRAGNLIFEAFSPQMSVAGLRSLCDILTTKEGRDSHKELFEDGDINSEDGSEHEEDSDQQSLDSDVEVVDGSDSDSEEDQDDAESDSNEATDSDDESSDGANAELAKFESALAAALGTRKINEADLEDDDNTADTSSDSDMSDSEMMGLDEKLAEVFKNQQSETSAQKFKKEEMKTVKENVINLKNRAMDLVELFLRSQQARGSECAELLITLLQMAGMTATPQLTNRGTEIVKRFCQKAKGTRLPEVEQTPQVRVALSQQLQNLHDLVVKRDTSNATIAVASQLNILLFKLLLRAGEEDVNKLVKKVRDEQGPKEHVERRALQDFWSRYNAWASTVPPKTQQRSKAELVKGTHDKPRAKGKKEDRMSSKIVRPRSKP